MTEEQKEKYANFLDKVSEILGLNKPVDILRLCAVTDEYLRPIEKHIAELEKENAELKAEIRKMKSQHFTDIRLYTKVIGIAVEESVMNDKQNYKNYLFDKAKKILSMGVDK